MIFWTSSVICNFNYRPFKDKSDLAYFLKQQSYRTYGMALEFIILFEGGPEGLKALKNELELKVEDARLFS